MNNDLLFFPLQPYPVLKIKIIVKINELYTTWIMRCWQASQVHTCFVQISYLTEIYDWHTRPLHTFLPKWQILATATSVCPINLDVKLYEAKEVPTDSSCQQY